MTIQLSCFFRPINLLVLTAFLGFSSCTKKDAAPNATSEKLTSREVNLAIWNNYISDASLEKFAKETGIKVNVTTYASNEELLAKVQSGASGIDVAVPSDYMVDVMIKSGLLEKLNPTKIPNKSDVVESVLKQDFDPQNEYSLPYAWSTTGIAYNSEKFKGKMESWKDFFEDPTVAGKVSMLDDEREAFAAALKYSGFSVNTISKDEIEKASALLKQFKKKLKMFRSESIDALTNEEVIVAHAYSSDALQAQIKTKGKIKFILPKEGGTKAIDNVVVLKGSANLDSAHALINYMLSKDVNVEFVKTVMGGPVLKGTKAALPEEIANNPSLFPADEQLTRFEKLVDVGDHLKLYDKAWTKIKTN